MTKKPLGITATAIYSALNGVINLLIGLFLLIVSQARDSSIIYMAVGVLGCILGVFMFTAVYGLWSHQEWGRKLSIWLYGISAIFGIISIFPIWPQQKFTAFNTVLQLVGIGICAIIIRYMLKQHIKSFFGKKIERQINISPFILSAKIHE